MIAMNENNFYIENVLTIDCGGVFYSFYTWKLIFDNRCFLVSGIDSILINVISKMSSYLLIVGHYITTQFNSKLMTQEFSYHQNICRGTTNADKTTEHYVCGRYL